MASWIERFRLWRLRRRRYFMLKPEAMRPGDIFFSTEREKSSWLIRLSTRSSYSHASIYLGDSLYAEAIDLGVRTRSATTIINERLKVIRLKGASQGEAASRAAAERINHYLHAPYALGSAMLSLFGNIPAKDPRALFCSQLIAQAYADIGVAVVPGLEPVKVTPALLASSPLFDDVTETATFRAFALPEHLVLTAFETLSDRETIIIERMYQALRPFFETRGIAVPAGWYGMLQFLADVDHKALQENLDVEVYTTMKDAGYIELHGASDALIKSFADWVANLDPSQLTADQVAHYRYSFTNNLKAMQRQAQDDLDNLRFWTEEVKKTSLGTFRIMVKSAEAHHRQRTLTIALTRAALDKLGWQDDRPGPA